mmetsp:Transcript_13382/g.24217  ORF Transcript_13382/g.24217 Transcript_13382/m.24217 type:complete len:273 (-) Transcript_13382:113-931(-)
MRILEPLRKIREDFEVDEFQYNITRRNKHEITSHKEIKTLNQFPKELRRLSNNLDTTAHRQKRNIRRLDIIEIQNILLLAQRLLQFLLLKIHRRSHQPGLEKPKEGNIQCNWFPPCSIEEEPPEESTRSTHDQISVKCDNLYELRRTHQNKSSRQRKNSPRQKSLHRLMKWQNPIKTILLNKRPHRLVEKTLHDAQFQTNPKQSTGDEGSVFFECFVSDYRAGGSLEETVKSVGGAADWFEGVGIEGSFGEGGCSCGGEGFVWLSENDGGDG